ncbi:MAG: TonB-dependent receptor plug domain-containing protein, partial [Bacteroidetes bacterium]|nr:TonB-dependent receptor plug domain-containing protein [Bacteroidota bacterium]
ELNNYTKTANSKNLATFQTEQITQKELSKAACCDMAGCFETQATVQPQTTNVITNSKELRILGLSGVYNQVLIDGFPLIQGLSYTYGISSYPGSLIDNIFVSKGANSVLHGYESISGQINLIPKSADKTDRLFANIYINSFGEKHVNFNYANTVGKAKKWNTFLALHSVQPANKFDRDGDKFLDLPKLTRYMIYNKWKYGSENVKGLYANIGWRLVTENRVGGQVDFNPDTDKGSNKVYGQTVGFYQPEIYSKLGYRFNAQHSLVFSFSTFYQSQTAYFGTTKYMATQLNSYINLQHEVLWKKVHQLKYGVSYRYQVLKEEITIPQVDSFRHYGGTYQTNLSIPGFFAENILKFGERLTIITGARIDRHQTYGYYFTPRAMVKVNINKSNTLRMSSGKGWRQVNLFSENINLLASSRDILFQEKLKPEEAFNWGINYVYSIDRKKFSGTLSLDFYQTRFSNQFFPDYDSDPRKAIIKNYDGQSISNAFQVDISAKFLGYIEFKAGYNFLNVFRVIDGAQYILPFNPKNRLMTAISIRPQKSKWMIDMNMHWYDKQRLPNTSKSPSEYQQADYSKAYELINVQVTYKAKRIEYYAGCENALDFRQRKPIIGWQDPFGPYFDTSSVWGPTRGRELYIGARWKLK